MKDHGMGVVLPVALTMIGTMIAHSMLMTTKAIMIFSLQFRQYIILSSSVALLLN